MRAIAAALLTTSCALFSLDVSSQRAASAPQFEPLDPQSVAILHQRPASSYTVVGTIRIGWPGVRTDQEILDDAKIQNSLREQAARLGADAVTDIVLIPNLGQRGRVHEFFANSLVATAIRINTPKETHAASGR
jgi:hypothetical protein